MRAFLYFNAVINAVNNTFVNFLVKDENKLKFKMKLKLCKPFFMETLPISVNDNILILDASIKYILETERFDGSIS